MRRWPWGGAAGQGGEAGQVRNLSAADKARAVEQAAGTAVSNPHGKGAAAETHLKYRCEVLADRREVVVEELEQGRLARLGVVVHDFEPVAAEGGGSGGLG